MDRTGSPSSDQRALSALQVAIAQRRARLPLPGCQRAGLARDQRNDPRALAAGAKLGPRVIAAARTELTHEPHALSRFEQHLHDRAVPTAIKNGFRRLARETQIDFHHLDAGSEEATVALQIVFGYATDMLVARARAGHDGPPGGGASGAGRGIDGETHSDSSPHEAAAARQQV